MIRLATASLAAQAVGLAALAIWLLADPHSFYAEIPGVAESGPLNAHLLRDLGLTYLTFALASAAALTQRTAAPLITVLIAGFFVMHAALHASTEATFGNAQLFLREAPGVYGLALAAIAVAVSQYRFK